MVPRTARQLGRLDRYVRKSCLRAPDGASRCRLSHSLEEALRLASLPGEEEGRIYCFRRVNVSGIPAGADRGVWLDKVQHALRALAGHAVHADEPHAGAVDAVYFNGEQEALETVLRRLTHAPVRRDERRPEWFLASFLGVAPEASAAIQIEAALHRLRAPEMPAGAAAAIVLAAIGADDPGPLLAAVPESTVREWVREWTRTANAAPDSPAVRIPEHFREMVKRVAARFGWRDSRTSWLALLVLTYLHPTAMAFGNPIHAVRVALHDLEAAPREPARIPRPKPLLVPSARNATIRFDEFDEDVEETAEAAPAAVLRYSAPVPASPAPRRNGEPTASAGLYFLLNALRRLGIATVLETCPQLRGAGFVEHIFKSSSALRSERELPRTIRFCSAWIAERSLRSKASFLIGMSGPEIFG
jgi:hypothetical protein